MEYYEYKDGFDHWVVRKEGEGFNIKTFSGTVVKVYYGGYYTEGYWSNGWSRTSFTKAYFTEEGNQPKGEAMKKFKIGDKVKVTGKGAKDGWSDKMEDYIGKTGTVDDVDDVTLSVPSLSVLFADSNWWWYYPENLELVEEAGQEEKVQAQAEQLYICSYPPYLYGQGDTPEEAYKDLQELHYESVSLLDCKFWKAAPIEVKMKLEVQD